MPDGKSDESGFEGSDAVHAYNLNDNGFKMMTDNMMLINQRNSSPGNLTEAAAQGNLERVKTLAGKSGCIHADSGHALIEDKKTRLESVEQFIAKTKAVIRHGGNRAFYNPANDIIQIPEFRTFRDEASYYAILAHELTHWTGHDSRLNRNFEQSRFKGVEYAAEELVAEIGAAFLCADLGITPETREDHAAYVQNWLTLLKKDSRVIFTAASRAQRAVEFLHGLTSMEA